MGRLIRLRPELSTIRERLREELNSIADIEPLARHISCEQARLCTKWPENISIKTLLLPSLGDQFSNNLDHNKSCLEELLDRVLRRIEDQNFVWRLLTLVVYASRPLTVTEFCILMFIGSYHDTGRQSGPSISEARNMIHKMETWFAGIVQIRKNEVKLAHPRLREIFLAKRQENEGTKERIYDCHYIWYGIQDEAEFVVTQTCLEYLSRSSVQELVQEAVCSVHSADSYDSSNLGFYRLCPYAIHNWPRHFSRISSRPSITLLSEFVETAITEHWFKAY